MIRIRDLSVRLKKSNGIVPIIEKVCMDLPKGEISFLTGVSGAGKSVLAKTIAGLLPPELVITTGIFHLNGRQIDYPELTKRRGNGIFYAPQNARAALNPVLKIERQFKDIHSYDRRRVLNLLSELAFGNPDRILKAYSFELSEGEAQRIIVAMGVLLKPDLFILDEPVTSLDRDTTERMLKRLVRINRCDHTTLLIITHDLLLLEMKDEAGERVLARRCHMEMT